MNNFSWKKVFGFGLIIWLVMFAAASAFVGFESGASLWAQMAMIILSGILAFVFARYSNIQSAGQALGYGISWALIGLFLDLLITYQFTQDVFSSWQYWTTYALIVVVPWIEMEINQTNKLHV